MPIQGYWGSVPRGNNYSITQGQVASPTGAGVAITSSASANTKGSYTQIVSATSIQAAGLIVHCTKGSNNISEHLIDIAIGGSGSEQIIVSNLLHGVTGFGAVQYFFPIPIPSGTRISARLQATAGNRISWIHVTLTNGHPSYSRVETWGANTSTSGGVTLDAGGSANTKGSYAQLISSTGFATQRMFFSVGSQAVNHSANDFLCDIAVDIGGNKQIILANIGLHNNSNVSIEPAILGPFTCVLPAGSNIYARTQSLSTTSATRQFGLVGYGIG